METQKTNNYKTANDVTLPQSEVRHKCIYLYAVTAAWWFVYVTYRTCDRQRQSVVGLVTAGRGT